MKRKNKTIFCNFISLLLICLWVAVPFAQEIAPEVTESKESDNEKFEVDLDLKDADIRDVARALSKISGLNIIVSQDVRASVTLRIQNTNWKEALGIILATYNLTMTEGDNYIVIATFENLRQTEERGDLQTKVMTLNFVDATQIQKTLTSLLTGRGKIETDIRSNSLVITDIPDRIKKIEGVAQELDNQTPQVMIEAMMLTVKLNDDEQWGVDWTLTSKDRPERSIKQPLGLATGGSAYTGFLKYGKTILPWANFVETIDFWLQTKKAEILANPRIMTLDNLAATIDLTERVAYTSTTQSTESTTVLVTTSFEDVPVKLQVKPHITKDGHVFMNILTQQSYQSGTAANSQPIIDSRRAETNLMVKDGDTVVIGGLRKKEKTETVQKFPILGDIPLLGYMFRKTVIASVDTELIIFVTPHIIKDNKMTASETNYIGRFGSLREAKENQALKQVSPFPLRAPIGAKVK
jgi:type IV pilus assembly protein PilQ